MHFRFLCFFREGRPQRRGYNYLIPWLCLAAVLIFLQYSYNAFGCGWLRSNDNKTATPFVVHKVLHYHQRLQSYERFMAMNFRFINLGASELPQYNEFTPMCRLNLDELGNLNFELCPVNISRYAVNLNVLEKHPGKVQAGGFYAPRQCRPRHRVAIFIPYRNRAKNLAIWLNNMHPFLQKQLLYYRIFVIEQYGKGKFNKGALYNAAFLESQRFGTWHCLIFHDVDLIPQDQRILYSCPRKPTHMSTAVESMKYILGYPQLFGGVTAMTPQQYLKVNGYSNMYWNWGAEDDDMFIRLQASRLPVLRYNSSIARYATLPHKKGTRNQYRHSRLSWAKHRFRYEGLRSLQYKLLGISKNILFTHILVDVNPFKYEEI